MHMPQIREKNATLTQTTETLAPIVVAARVVHAAMRINLEDHVAEMQEDGSRALQTTVERVLRIAAAATEEHETAHVGDPCCSGRSPSACLATGSSMHPVSKPQLQPAARRLHRTQSLTVG